MPPLGIEATNYRSQVYAINHWYRKKATEENESLHIENNDI